MPNWEYCQIVWKAGRVSETEKRELEQQGLERVIAYGEGVVTFGILTMLG